MFFLPVSRVLLKEKGKPPPGPPVQQPRGLAGLFGSKKETPKLFKAMLGAKGKDGLAKLLQLKKAQDLQVMPQKKRVDSSKVLKDTGRSWASRVDENIASPQPTAQLCSS